MERSSSADGLIETHVDLLTVGLVSLGIILFFTACTDSIDVFVSKYHAQERGKDLLSLGRIVSSHPMLIDGETLSAESIAKVSRSCPDGELCSRFFSSFPEDTHFAVKFRWANNSFAIWREKPKNEMRMKCPVLVELNPLHQVVAEMEVTMWK